MTDSKFNDVQEYSFDSPSPQSPGILLWGLENPGNLGALVRTNACFAIPEIHLYGSRDLTANNSWMKFAHRICTAGSGDNQRWSKVMLWRIPPNQGLLEHYLSHFDCRVATTSNGRADQVLYQMNLPKKILFMFGNERSGLPEEAYDVASNKTTIPMANPGDCLNISNAHAIMMAFYRAQHPINPSEVEIPSEISVKCFFNFF